MKNRRLLSVLLCALLCIGLIPATVFAAEEEPDKWDGTADTSWYNETDTEFHIKTAEQLAGFAELTNIGIDTSPSTGNTFENKTIYLDCDVDLGGHTWTPITNRNVDDGYFFKGTFDGQGHTIYNLNCSGKNNSYDSLFGYVQGGVIQNLSVVDANLYANDNSMHLGIIAALVENGKIINCYTSGTVESVNGWRNVGGISGSCMHGTQIIGCGSDAKIISRNSQYSDSVGGLVGQWSIAGETSVISDCWFNGSIVSEDPDSTVGGLLAFFNNYNNKENVKINNCIMVSSNISSVAKENTAVIAHLTGTPTVANCFYKESDDEYRVITKLENDSFAIDTSFDSATCAKAATDFTDNDILVSLQNNASQGVEWVEGIEHPTFSWDMQNRKADYTAVDAALSKVPQDLSIYTDETVSALQNAIDNVNTSLSVTEQSKVDAMAKAIEEAIANLEKKPQPTPTPTPTPDDDDDRIAGDDRFETAVEVAESLKKDWGVSKFKTVIVACSDDFADAMSATPLAIDRKAPILLVNENTEDFVRNYINNNLTKGGKVYIIGETGVVSKNFENSLTCTVERLGGLDRYLTNLEVLNELGVTSGDDIMVASALNYPDALSVSATGNPILLVKDKLFDEQKEYLGGLKGTHDYFIIGETEAVNNTVMGEIKKYGTTERVGGANRYETSVDVAEKFYDRVKRMYVASGDDFPDALTGGVIANANDAPLLLVNKNNTSQAAAYASAKGITKVVAIGGNAVIPDATLDKIA